MAIRMLMLFHQTSMQRMYEQSLFELIPLLNLFQSGDSRETLKFTRCCKVLHPCPSQWHCCFLSSSLFSLPTLSQSSRRCSQLQGARKGPEALYETTGSLSIVLNRKVGKANLRRDGSEATTNYK